MCSVEHIPGPPHFLMSTVFFKKPIAFYLSNNKKGEVKTKMLYLDLYPKLYVMLYLNNLQSNFNEDRYFSQEYFSKKLICAESLETESKEN